MSHLALALIDVGAVVTEVGSKLEPHKLCQARPKRVDARRSEPVALEAAAALLSVNAGQGWSWIVMA